MLHLRMMDWGAIALLVLIAFSLWRAHRDPAFNFSIFDLIMENGRVSRLACIFLASFLLVTWVMVRLTLDGKMTEGYFTSYIMTCFAGTVAKLFTGPSPKGDKDGNA